MWRSNLTNCILVLPREALGFAFKDKMKKIIGVEKTDGHWVKFTKNLASGAAAGALTISLVYSLDYARTRLATDVKVTTKGGERQFRGIIDVYAKTLKSDGFVGLYRGFFISCVGLIVYRGFYFGLFDTVNSVFPHENSGTLPLFVRGYGVTICAGLLSYPFDTVRRCMMMRSVEVVKYKGSWDCAIKVIRNEGILALWNGAAVSILHGSTGAAVLVGYTKLVALYTQWRDSQSQI